MKNSFKKLTAWLCCMALLISFIPATALPVFAAEVTDGTLAVADFETDGSVKLTTAAKLAGDIVLEAGDEFELDLNGWELDAKSNASTQRSFTVPAGAKLTIKNGEIVGKTTNATGALIVVNGGEVVLQDVSLAGNKSKSAANQPGGIYVTGGKVTIEGGSVDCDNATAGKAESYGHSLYAENATVNIDGGSVGAGESHVVLGNGATLNISGASKVDAVAFSDKYSATGAASVVNLVNLTKNAEITLADEITVASGKLTNDGSAEQNEEGVWGYAATKYSIYKADDDAATYSVGAANAAEGDTVTITASPADGNLVDKVIVTKKSGGTITATVSAENANVYTFTMPAEEVTVEVTFKEDDRTFTATVGTVTLGTVKLNGQDSVTGKAGTTVTVTPIPAEDTYDLVGIYVDGVKLEADNGVYSFAIKADAQNVVTATFVDPEAGEAFNGTIASGGKYYLSGDYTLPAGLTVSGEVTIDLMGNTLSGTSAPYFTIGENAKLTIKDSVDGGEVKGITADKAMILVNGGEFVLEDGKLTGHKNPAGYGGAILLDAAGATFTMNGGEISGNTAKRGAAIATKDKAEATDFVAHITINGGKIGVNNGTEKNATGDSRGVTIYSSTYNPETYNTLTITGGIIEMGKGWNAGTENAVIIGGNGTENVWLRCVDLVISGNPEVEGLFVGRNGTLSVGTTSIGSLNKGAKIRTQSTLTIATGDDTVATAKVGDFNVYTYNPQPKTITVDTNVAGGSLSAATTAKYGDTVTVTAIPNSGYALKEIIVKDTATGEVLATITDGNTFTMFDCNVTVTATFVAMTAEQTMVTLAPVQPAEGGTVTVTGVDLNQVVAAGAEVTVTAAHATGYIITVTVNGTAVPLTNNTYTFTAQGGQSYSIAATAAKIDYDVTVAYGAGSLEGVEVNELAETAKYGDEITVTVPTGYLLESISVKDAANGDVAVTDGKFTMPASAVTITVVIKEMPLADGGALPPSGKIETPTKYTLTEDVVLTGGLDITSVVEIDLNGHTISMNESVVPVPKFFDIAAGAKLTIKDSSEEQDGKVQFKNVVPNPLPEGKTVSNYSNPGVNISGTFVLEGGELTGWSRVDAAGTAGAGGMVFVQKDGTFTMKGGKLTEANASSASAIRAENDGAVVNLLGGEITRNNTGNVIVNVGKGKDSVTPAQLNIGGDFKIYGNKKGGVPYTYEAYEIKFQNANATISGTPELGMVAADANGALEISGAPVINSLRATLNDDGTLKDAKSITLGELEEGALIITGGGLILEKAGTEIPEGITSVYWNNQDKLGTWYQGHIYLPAIESIYGEPMSNITLPGNGLLTWADEEGTFDQAGDAEADVVVNDVTIKLPVTVAAKEIAPAIGAIAAQYYNGEAIEPTLVVTYGEETLVEGEDYTVTYADNTYPGTASVTIEPVEGGRYTFDTEAEYAKATFVINKGEETTATIERVVKVSGETLEIALADYLPAGYGVANVVSVVNGDFITVSDTLVDGKLVVTAAASALNAEDEATVVVGMTHYENATLTLSVKAIERVVPTGVPATYGQTLAERGVPAYGWEWLNPSELVGDVGTHTFQAYFNGDKNDVADVTVTVSAKEEFTDLTYTLDKDTVVFTGVAVTPVVTVKDGDTVLELGKDYTVTYEGNDKKNPAAKVIIEAMGNYKFTVEKTFAITEGVSTAGATKKQYYNAVSDTVTIAQLSSSEFKVPVNAGTVNYTLNSYTEGKLSNVKVENGVVSYTIGFTTPGTATIVVDVTFDNYAATTITLTIEMLQKTSTNDPIVAPGVGGGGGGGGFMEPEVDDEPGTTVTTDDNGNKVTTTTDKNGNSTVVVEATNGVTATTTSDLYGKYTTNVVIPSSAVSGSEPVVLPVEGKGQATVDVPGTIEVEFPVETMTPGTIAVIVNADGTEELIQEAKQTESGMLIVLTEDCTVKVYDNAKSFDDVSGHWSKDAVSYVTARGMFAGTGNGSTFSPDVKMTRAMLAQVIYNLEGAEDHSYDANFTDIDDGAWYSKAVNWAASEGIVSGYGDNSYQPDKALTREEVVQIFFNYAKSKGYDMSHSADLSTFADGHNVSDWATAAKQWAVGAGLISGKGGNILDAKGGATRGEGAQMFMNFCNNIVE